MPRKRGPDQPVGGSTMHDDAPGGRRWSRATLPRQEPRLLVAAPRPWSQPRLAAVPEVDPEPTIAPEPDDFDRAVEIVDRLHANLASVVRGKPDQIRLV